MPETAIPLPDLNKRENVKVTCTYTVIERFTGRERKDSLLRRKGKGGTHTCYMQQANQQEGGDLRLRHLETEPKREEKLQREFRQTP